MLSFPSIKSAVYLSYREEIEKQQAHERYMRLQEQGKTEQARKDLGTYMLQFSYRLYFLLFEIILIFYTGLTTGCKIAAMRVELSFLVNVYNQ